ncbi:MAG: hypothetical protein EKK46_08310 [Rhodocyclaceae bacterium]|nr:MAG: hypothetical protein EKK46_08310 [Rhodocyclaceae bacterium]
MIETNGRIVAVHDGRVDVELAQTTACTACNAKRTCASSKENSHQAGRTQIVTMDAPLYARAGDEVTVTVSTRGFHIGVLLAYLLPTMTTIFGALIFAPGGDVASAAGLLGGLVLGLLLVRLIGRLMPHLSDTYCEPTSTSHPSI